MKLYAGLDWASAEHAVCVIDEHGQIIERCTVAHTAIGLAALLRQLKALAAEHPIPIAIERPSGLVVDTLVAAGQPIVPIHPNVVKASRSRYSSAGAKSDPGDAYLLADLLRTDGHRFRPLEPLSDEIRALRSRSRTRDDLVATRVQLANQLRSLLESFWPGAAVIFAHVDSLTSLAFLERYPAPRDAAKLNEKHLRRFVADHGYTGRRTPAQLLERLRAAPVGQVGSIEEEAKQSQVLALVAVLRPVVLQISKLTREIEQAIEQLPAGRIVMSCRARGGSTPLRSSPSSVTRRRASSTATTWPPRPVSCRSRVRRVSTGQRSAGSPATSGSGARSRPGRTTRAALRTGRQPSTGARGPADATILMPCASWPAHGAASCGAAGRMASSTIRLGTLPRSRSSRHQRIPTMPEA